MNATAPASTTDRLSSVVATGRLMNGEERLMAAAGRLECTSARFGDELRFGAVDQRRPQAIEEQVDDRRREQRQHLADEQAADHRRGRAAGAARRPSRDENISGSAPNSAASVVIRIGRKRSSAAW